MSAPSPGLAMAWRIAASEAGAAGYPKIECAHLMMGLLSLDKANPKALKDLGFDPARMSQVGAEQAAIAELFESAGVTTRVLRRDLRSRVKKKPSRAKGVMSRSAASKTAFARAELLAGTAPMNALHLLAVLLKAPDPVIVSLLLEHRLGPDIATRAEAAASLPFETMAAKLPPKQKTASSRVVAEVLAEKKGLPIGIVTDRPGEGARLLKLEAHLKSKIIGQDEAVAKVAARVRLAHSGLSERRGPLAVFLLLGPTGVGKTAMARTLAKFLFGGAENLSRFDMSEYMEEQSVSRLIGAPPGSAGHEEPGQLTEAIRRKPCSVILFDEVEKAHPKVLDLLLQLFDAGRLTDSQGLVADAKNTIVVMTSNLGTGAADAAKTGFAAKGNETLPVTKAGRVKAHLRRFFRMELLNRIDEIITLRSLDLSDVRRIARPLLAALVNEVRKTKGVFLRFEPDAEAFVIRSGFDAQKGVGELKRVIERLVEMPLSSLALSGKLARHPAWKAVYDEGGLYFLPE